MPSQPRKVIPSEYQPNLASVIVPTYNRVALLLETIRSVATQSHRPLELLICDDGSTDDTPQAVRDFRKQHLDDPGFTVRYLHQQNQGACAARNLGMCESRGEFIQFLDSDDLLTRRKIASQIHALRCNAGANVAYGPWRCIYGIENPRNGGSRQTSPMASDEDILRGHLAARWFCPPLSYLHHRSVVLRIGLWNEQLQGGDDADYIVRAALCGGRFVHEREAGVLYRRHSADYHAHRTKDSRDFASRFSALEGWVPLLDAEGLLDTYAHELAEHILYLRTEGMVRGIQDIHRECEKLVERIGRGSYRLPRVSFRDRISARLKRLNRRAIQPVFGEYPLALLREIIGRSNRA